MSKFQFLLIGEIDCPFVITTHGSVSYGPIAVPKGGDVVHHGASVTVENAEEIVISFMMVSTYLTSKYFSLRNLFSYS